MVSALGPPGAGRGQRAVLEEDRAAGEREAVEGERRRRRSRGLDGRSRSEMLRTPRAGAHDAHAGMVERHVLDPRWPRSSVRGRKRTSRRSSSASGGPGSRSSSRRPVDAQVAAAQVEGELPHGQRRPVWASTCQTTAQRARLGSASQSRGRRHARAVASRATATVSQRRRRVTASVCLARRPSAYPAGRPGSAERGGDLRDEAVEVPAQLGQGPEQGRDEQGVDLRGPQLGQRARGSARACRPGRCRARPRRGGPCGCRSSRRARRPRPSCR